jgi:hypothetical protein
MAARIGRLFDRGESFVMLASVASLLLGAWSQLVSDDEISCPNSSLHCRFPWKIASHIPKSKREQSAEISCTIKRGLFLIVAVWSENQAVISDVNVAVNRYCKNSL